MTLFPRSIRSLEADGFRASAFSLFASVLVLAAWLAWFFLARISVYKVATAARLEQRPCISCAANLPTAATAVVDFPASTALAHIRPGQPAYLHLDGFPRSFLGGIQAEVTSVASEVMNGNIRVELVTLPDPDAGIALRSNLTATVEVEVEQLPPAILLLRTTRRWLHVPQKGETD